MSSGSFDFRVGSLNIRGINKHSKRVATFNWVKNKNFDLTFLQETYSAKTDENLWQTEWGRPIFWSHGTKHGCGVSILVKKGFDFNPIDIVADQNGRYLIIKAQVQGDVLFLVNLYAPNTNSEKSVFFKK